MFGGDVRVSSVRDPRRTNWPTRAIINHTRPYEFVPCERATALSRKSYTVPEVVTGKPTELGGKPGRVEATGRGVAMITEKILDYYGHSPDNATVAIQGFGNVGSWAGRLLAERGANVVATSDVTGGIYDPNGIDTHAVAAHVEDGNQIEEYEGDADPSRTTNCSDSTSTC